jgi:hypothetical protein
MKMASRAGLDWPGKDGLGDPGRLWRVPLVVAASKARG